jgi:hypothetical protein
MESPIFCESCRGLRVGWNRRYVRHALVCLGGVATSLRILTYTVSAFFILSVVPTAAEMFPAAEPEPLEVPESASAVHQTYFSSDPAIWAIEDVLSRHSRLIPAERARVARAVVASATRHDVDPFLIASILLVESAGNRFAISNKDAVGLMQIHVPTWGGLIDAEGINLFVIEENIDLGTRILKDYTVRYGLWNGVMRYLGARSPTEEGLDYVARVQRIYGDRHAD